MSSPVRQFNPSQPEQIIEITGPPDGDCDTGYAVFENQIPTGNPGQEFSQGGIRIGIGGAGHGNHGGKLCIAECREGAGQTGKDKGQNDARPGSRPVDIADDGGADQDEDAGADDRADAEGGEIPGREGLF